MQCLNVYQDVSSTKLRQILKSPIDHQQTINEMTPKNVKEYLLTQELYKKKTDS